MPLDAHAITERIASAPVAMAVLETRTAAVIAANPAYADLLGRSVEDTIGLLPADYLDGDRLEASLTVIHSIREGWVDALEGHVEFRRADGLVASAYSWSVPLGSRPPHESMLVGAAPDGGERMTGFDAHRVDPTRVVLGTLDHDWRFNDVTVGSAALLGWPAGEEGRTRLHELVHPGDAPVLLALLGRAAYEGESTTIRARIRGAGGEWLPAEITVSPLCAHASPRFGVAISLLPDGEAGRDLERAVRVEEQLWQLAADVRAELLTAPATIAHEDVADLTARQQDIVRRLVRGQRVESIARDLFVSRSTVRNHLSEVYRKLGVRSQAQLLDHLLAAKSGTGRRSP